MNPLFPESAMKLDEQLAKLSNQTLKETLNESGCTRLINQALKIKRPETSVTQLGPCKLLERIGQGGMGEVWRAWHEKLGKVVAVKRLHPQVFQRPELRERFNREMKVAGKLEHPNIAQITYADEFQGTAFLVMEHIVGLSLNEWLSNTNSSTEISVVVAMMIQVGKGLTEAHRNGVIHRDLKPSNIMLSDYGQVKVLDFGLARLTSNDDTAINTELSLTEAGRTLGTLDYMSPEQIMDSRTADERSDIYSWGATIYKLLTGQNACMDDADSTPQARIVAIATKTPRELKSVRADVPDKLNELVQNMLAKPPEKRPQTAQQVVEVLESIQESLAPMPAITSLTEDRPSSLLKTKSGQLKLPPNANRFKWWWLALAPVLLAMMSIIIVLQNPDGSHLTIECADNIAIMIEKVDEVSDSKSVEVGEMTKVTVGTWRITLPPEIADQYQISESQITLTKGDEKVVTVTRIAKGTEEPDFSTPVQIDRMARPTFSDSKDAVHVASPYRGLLTTPIRYPGIAETQLQPVFDKAETVSHPFASAISPDRRYFAWASSEGGFVRDMDSNEIIQFSRGDFIDVGWLTSSNSELLVVWIPRYPSAYGLEVRALNGILQSRLMFKPWQEGQSLIHNFEFQSLANSKANSESNSDLFLIWSGSGAAILNSNGQILAMLKDERLERHSLSAGIISVAEREYEILFSCEKGIIRSWKPKWIEPIDPSRPLDDSRVYDVVNLQAANSDDELEEWFDWNENGEQIKLTDIVVAPNNETVLLTCPGPPRTILLDRNRSILASKDFSSRFAFNPSSTFVADIRGKIYDKQLMSIGDLPRVESNHQNGLPDLANDPLQIFWPTEDAFYIASGARNSGVVLLKGLPLQNDLKPIFISPVAADIQIHSQSNHDLVASAFVFGTSNSFQTNFGFDGTVKQMVEFDPPVVNSRPKINLSGDRWICPINDGFHLLDQNQKQIAIEDVAKSEAQTWAPSGKQFVSYEQVENEWCWCFRDSDGKLLQRRIGSKSGQVIWSPNDRYFVVYDIPDDAEEIEKVGRFKATIFDLENKNREFSIAYSHNVKLFDPTSISDDSRWLCLGPVEKPNSPQRKVILVNLDSGVSKATNVQNDAFAFSPISNQVITSDGIHEITEDGSLQLLSPIPKMLGNGWFIRAVGMVSDEEELTEKPQLKILMVQEQTGLMSKFAWVSPKDKNVRLRPIHGISRRDRGRVILNKQGAVLNLPANDSIVFLPFDESEPIQFRKIYGNRSVLAFDQFGNIDTSAMKGSVNDYVTRTLNYPGGRTVSISEESLQDRIALPDSEKRIAWLRDLGAMIQTSDGTGQGKLTAIEFDSLLELSAADLSVLDQCMDLESIVIKNCARISNLPFSDKDEALPLTELDLQDTHVGDGVGPFLLRCPKLEKLNVTGTGFSALFINNILACKNLKSLQVSKSLMTDAVRKRFEQELPDCKIETK